MPSSRLFNALSEFPAFAMESLHKPWNPTMVNSKHPVLTSDENLGRKFLKTMVKGTRRSFNEMEPDFARRYPDVDRNFQDRINEVRNQKYYAGTDGLKAYREYLDIISPYERAGDLKSIESIKNARNSVQGADEDRWAGQQSAMKARANILSRNKAIEQRKLLDRRYNIQADDSFALPVSSSTPSYPLSSRLSSGSSSSSSSSSLSSTPSGPASLSRLSLPAGVAGAASSAPHSFSPSFPYSRALPAPTLTGVGSDGGGQDHFAETWDPSYGLSSGSSSSTAAPHAGFVPPPSFNPYVQGPTGGGPSYGPPINPFAQGAGGAGGAVPRKKGGSVRLADVVQRRSLSSYLMPN